MVKQAIEFQNVRPNTRHNFFFICYINAHLFCDERLTGGSSHLVSDTEFTSAHRNKQADHIKWVPRHHGMALSNIADGDKECSCKSVLFSIVRLQEPISRIILDLGYIKVFARWRRPFCSGLSQQIKPGSIILNRKQKGAGQGMVLTGQTRTCFSLAQGCRRGQRLCGKK
jgi:hypothetical protein